jgi:hypothetical protein
LGFFQVWLTGYYSPSKVIEGLRDKPAPHWGVYAACLRGLLDAFLLYLPLALMGRQPSTPSYITFLPAETYFAWSVLFAPPLLVFQWLLLGALLHVILRLSSRPSDIDQILNITGMAGLVVGAFLVIWDWVWILLGWQNEVLLGISHLVLVIWAVVITTTGFKRILGLPVWLGILLNVIWLLLGEPLALIFMRAPV